MVWCGQLVETGTAKVVRECKTCTNAAPRKNSTSISRRLPANALNGEAWSGNFRNSNGKES